MFRSVVVLAAMMAGVAQGSLPWPGTDGLAEGQEICVYGYIMDFFCVNRGTLLDANTVETLKNPELHSLHCLLDIPQCYESPYHILQPPAEGSDMYGTGWAVADNAMLLTSGREQGSTDLGCTTCTGGGEMKMGYRAEVKGTVATLDPPVLNVVAVMSLGEGDSGCVTMEDGETDAPGLADAGNATEAPAGTTDAPATAAPSGASTATVTSILALLVGAAILV